MTIVGGGPAGLTTAIALRLLRADVEVTVLEKEAYPREKICAGAIGRRGDRALEALGIWINVPSAVVHGMSLATRFGERAHREERPIGRVIRRIEFDAALADEARKRGVRIVTGAKVVAEGGALLLAGKALHGLVIGADGVGSVVRRAMGLGAGDRNLRAQVLEADTAPVPQDRDRTFVHFDLGSSDLPGYFWDFPTLVDGEPLMSRGVYLLGGGREAKELEARLGERLARVGVDLGSSKKKRFSERGFCVRDTVARVTVHGDRLLVGEAAGIDPATGEGIAPAIEMGALAGKFLARVVAGRARVGEWDHVLARSAVGIDLRIRSRAARALYGPSRAKMEALLATSRTMRVGCNMFSGERPKAVDVPLLALDVARAWITNRGRDRRQIV